MLLGYYYYAVFWYPVRNQKLSCTHKENNPFDMFAIKVCEGTKIVGHLPIEISGASKCLMDSGAVQGGLEIPAKEL